MKWTASKQTNTEYTELLLHSIDGVMKLERKTIEKYVVYCMYFCLKVYQHFLTAKINTTRVSSLSSYTPSNQSIDGSRQMNVVTRKWLWWKWRQHHKTTKTIKQQVTCYLNAKKNLFLEKWYLKKFFFKKSPKYATFCKYLQRSQILKFILEKH